MLRPGESAEGFREVTAAERTALERSDASWVKPPQSFIDRWNTAAGQHGRYNEATGYFELNGLTDITYAEALKIMAFDTHLLFSDGTDQHHGWKLYELKLRTVMPVESRGVNAYLSGHFMSQIDIWIYQRSNTHANDISGGAFPDPVTIIDKVRITSPSANLFRTSPRLENVKIYKQAYSLDLSTSPKISLESLQYIVDEAANTSSITVTLHPEAFARLTDELIAEATAKNIQFATTE